MKTTNKEFSRIWDAEFSKLTKEQQDTITAAPDGAESAKLAAKVSGIVEKNNPTPTPKVEDRQVLTGIAAIEAAEKDSAIVLCKYADPTEDAREGLTTSEARDIARIDPGLIYIIL